MSVLIPKFIEPIWETWQPREKGVLCFILQDKQVLLIRKKRGLGAGKINGPGGRIEPGETLLAAAVRETQEEVGLTPLDIVAAGELSFAFVDGYSLHCTVFRAEGFEGALQETDEAWPFWCRQDEIPFSEMWADDILWFPHMLQGKYFQGYFTFSDDQMLSHRIVVG